MRRWERCGYDDDAQVRIATMWNIGLVGFVKRDTADSKKRRRHNSSKHACVHVSVVFVAVINLVSRLYTF